jgi:hypothetical protein
MYFFFVFIITSQLQHACGFKKLTQRLQDLRGVRFPEWLRTFGLKKTDRLFDEFVGHPSRTFDFRLFPIAIRTHCTAPVFV